MASAIEFTLTKRILWYAGNQLATFADGPADPNRRLFMYRTLTTLACGDANANANSNVGCTAT
jgi:hypothetical protein